MSNNSQKISLPLIRPTSGQKKNTPSSGPSKMEVLAPEKVSAEFTKPQLLSKKESKLERLGSAASKKSNTSVHSSTDINAFESSKDTNIFASNNFNNTSRSQASNSAAQEELKKISSKPFNTRSKQKKNTAALEESVEINQSNRSTNLDASHPNFSTPARDVYSSTEYRSQGLLTNMHDTEEYNSAARLGLQGTPMTDYDLLMYDNYDDNEEEKNDEPIDIDINFGELQKKFDELAKLQKEREEIAREYVSVVTNRRSETGERLVNFPPNFAEIVKATVEEAKTMEELKEQGMMSENEIERFIMQKITSNLNNDKKAQTEKKEKEDPYAKEKEKIKELDRLLAQKEKEYRDRKNAEKMKRFEELQSMDESEISVESIDKFFLTEQQKRKSRISTSKSQAQSTDRQSEKDKSVSTIKPKVATTTKSHIQKNIDGAFAKNKEGFTSKLTEADQRRLDELMSVIEMTIDGEGNEEEAMRRAIPNPYDRSYGEGERMKEIDKRLQAYSFEEKIERVPNIDTSKFPKEKALRENAEKRALQERNEAVTKKLMEMNNKEKLNEVYDSNVIIALVEQLKKENGPLPVTERRDQDAEELERKLKEIDDVLKTFNEKELLDDLNSLAKNVQNVKQKLKLSKENIEAQSQMTKVFEQLIEQRTGMIKNLVTHKEALNKLDQNTVQNDLGDLSKLERKLIQMERSALDEEDTLRKSLNIIEAPVKFPEDPEITIEEYDKQITAQLRITNPELFKDIDDNEPQNQENDEVEIDENNNNEEPEEYDGKINYDAYNPVEEQSQEHEEDEDKA